MERPSKTNLYEDSHLRHLTALLGHIHAREVALPDFQRDFVWGSPMTLDLIVSIAHNHAAWSLWRIRNTQQLFAWREFQGAPADYLDHIRTTLGAGTFQELLQSHLLPGEPDSPLWRNDFEGFFARRQELLWQAIQCVTGLTHAMPMLDAIAPPPRTSV